MSRKLESCYWRREWAEIAPPCSSMEIFQAIRKNKESMLHFLCDDNIKDMF